MLYDVYDLGEEFRNADPMAALRAGPTLAEVRLSRRFTNSSESDTAARFYTPGSQQEVLRPLMYARITGISAGSMMIVGTAYTSAGSSPKSRTNSHTVGYLCKMPGAPVVVDPRKVAERQKARSLKYQASGFDPADDDDDATYGPLDPSVST